MHKKRIILLLLVLTNNSIVSMQKRPLPPFSKKNTIRCLLPALSCIAIGSGISIYSFFNKDRFSWKYLASGLALFASGIPFLSKNCFNFLYKKKKGVCCYNDALIDFVLEDTTQNDYWNDISLATIIEMKKEADQERKKRQLNALSFYQIGFNYFFPSTHNATEPDLLEKKINEKLKKSTVHLNQDEYLKSVKEIYQNRQWDSHKRGIPIASQDNNYLFNQLPKELIIKINNYVINIERSLEQLTIPITRHEFFIQILPYLYASQSRHETTDPGAWILSSSNEKKHIKDRKFRFYFYSIIELLTMHYGGFPELKKDSDGEIEFLEGYGHYEMFKKLVNIKSRNDQHRSIYVS